ncbi:uncharacterized protein NECHADRAFT_75854 [Fusarium vanettenii 77-13-4]|uniref:Uncharacterized protein n=1 Tax=Fusarium vanettenii (strain ATCC MYA-4622 / CBS 123669 / FGSC 9596 / NRRL 45880 / 77-13-4) TaxID=660122 RepID=C7Z5S7_FUSV7|nr:uncharacterized protein NECHADRAFT_75854 [Fusarium vanettenii 77-13-4]EEU40575.1 hypothetical protein NECHADRAFT_75854 [Fusarium vanettenii 77-13-4]
MFENPATSETSSCGLIKELPAWYLQIEAPKNCYRPTYLPQSSLTGHVAHMNPSLIGVDNWYNLVPLDNFPTCGKYMDDISCIGDLGFPLPSIDNLVKFYALGEISKNGTEMTILNFYGSITSPLSGETFSWTLGGIGHTVIVASADAKPTGSAGGKKADNENEDSDEDDEEDVASHLSP